MANSFLLKGRQKWNYAIESDYIMKVVHDHDVRNSKTSIVVDFETSSSMWDNIKLYADKLKVNDLHFTITSMEEISGGFRVSAYVTDEMILEDGK